MMHLTTRELFSADYGLQGPFTLELDTGIQLAVEEVLRYLPGKRLACQAQWKGARVFVKIFPRSAKGETCGREQRGLALLTEKNIRIAQLLECCTYTQCQAAFYEYLPGKAFSITEAGRPESLCLDRVEQAFGFIATLHNGNLIHNDLHVNNLMLVKDKLYLLDTGAVTHAQSEREKTENLALFIAQFPLSNHGELVSLRHYYEAKRGAPIEEGALKVAVKTCWERRKKQYLKKIMRNCTEVCEIKNKNRHVWVKRNQYTPAMKVLLDDLDNRMERGTFLKDGHSQTVVKVKVDEVPLVIKRYNRISCLNTIKRKLGINRARKCWRNAHLLEMIGIRTPSPVAIVEEERGAVYYLSEYVAGEKLSVYIKEKKKVDAFRRPLESLFERMHLARVTHGDLKAANILVDNKGVCLIDLDAMAEHPINYAHRRRKDQNRFRANFPADFQENIR